VVCYGPADFSKLSSVIAGYRNTRKLIVASDDPEVHNFARGIDQSIETAWLTGKDSFFSVCDNVLAILAELNSWFRGIARDGWNEKWQGELIYWVSHCEGGMTTQRVQDILLQIRNFSRILLESKVGQVVLIENSGIQWQQDLYQSISQRYAIPVRWISQNSFCRHLQRLKILAKPLLREAFYSAQHVVAKAKVLRIHRQSFPENERLICFELASSALKHVMPIVEVAKEFNRAGFKILVAGWGAFKGLGTVLSHGVATVSLERYCSFREVVGSWIFSLRVRSLIFARIGELSGLPVLAYNGVHLSTHLRDSMHFFSIDLARRYRLEVATKIFGKRIFPIAVRPWTTVFPEGVRFLANLRSRPLSFNFTTLSYEVNPYNMDQEWADIEFVWGERHATHLRRGNRPIREIAIVGNQNSRVYREIAGALGKSQSREKLQIPNGFRRYFFFGHQPNMAGYCSVRETQEVANTLLAACKERPEAMALLVKPHPSARGMAAFLNKVKEEGLRNVFYFDQALLPGEVLQASDVLVLKYSSIALEAMYLQVPSISAILDGERRFRYLDNATTYVETAHELLGLVLKLVDDEQFFQTWASEQRKMHRQFIDSDRPSSDIDTAASIVSTVQNFLRDR
jgi:hypothetical protein